MTTRKQETSPVRRETVTVGLLTTWSGLLSGDDGDPAGYGDFADRSVQVTGTLSGATVTIQGSLDGNTWATLTDPTQNELVFSSLKIEAITEATVYVRPVVTGGDANTNVTVLLFGRIDK
jgi:hypothetical protein